MASTLCFEMWFIVILIGLATLPRRVLLVQRDIPTSAEIIELAENFATSRSVQLTGLLIVDFGGILGHNKRDMAVVPTASLMHMSVEDVRKQINRSLRKCRKKKISVHEFCLFGTWLA